MSLRTLLFVGLCSIVVVSSARGAAPVASSSARQVPAVYLAHSRGWTLGVEKTQMRGLLTREIARQALLLAARDEWGLVTRDAWLDEKPRSQGLNLRLDIVASGGDASLIEVLLGEELTQELISSEEYKSIASPFDYAAYLADMESRSRTEFVQILKKQLPKGAGWVAIDAGRKPQANASLPPKVENWLRQMNVISQFLAVHTLHADIRRDGASPELLGGLVRGYANLGLLTEAYWHPMHQAFKARALLYAQRMVVQDPDGPNGKWHRAYAHALVGWHARAMADAKLTKQTPDSRPEWATAVLAHCRYDLAALAAIDETQPSFELAHLLRYVSAELSHVDMQAVRIAKQEVPILPSCTRIAGGLQNLRRKSESKVPIEPVNSVAEFMYTKLLQMPGLPGVAQTAVREFQNRPLQPASTEELILRADLIRALRSTVGSTASRSAGEEELSWQVLGRMLLEETFLEFLFVSRNVNQGDEEHLAALELVLEDHPYRLFLLNPSLQDDPKNVAQLYKTVDLDALELKEQRLYVHLHLVSNSVNDAARQASRDHEDLVTGDLVRGFTWLPEARRLDVSRQIYSMSPFSPLMRSMVIELDWANCQRYAEEWEKESAEQPSVLLALGRRYLTIGSYDDAERCLRAAIDLDADAFAKVVLADVYKRRGDVELWKKTLLDASQDPESKISPERVPILIADYYATSRQWDKARSYAEEAGQLGSQEGMFIAAYIYEALQDWGQSEKWVKTAATNNSEEPYLWYFWCRRTGQGHLKEAHELAKSYIEQLGGRTNDGFEPFRFKPRIPGTYSLLTDDLASARRYFEEEFSRNHSPAAGLHAVLIADKQNDRVRRDLLLKEIGVKLTKLDRSKAAHLLELAKFLIADIAKNGKAEFDWIAIDNQCAKANGAGQIEFNYFLAAYLDQHGKPEKAIEYWKRCMAMTQMNNLCRTLAGSELIKHGVKPSEYKAALHKPPDLTPGRPQEDSK
jgi:tetratricopeptide (TPR) repeat protein